MRKQGKQGGIIQEKGGVNDLNGSHVTVSFHVHIRCCCLFFYVLLTANRSLFCLIQTGIHFAFVQIPTSSGKSEIGESADYSSVEKVKNGLIQRITLNFPVFLQVLLPAQAKQTKGCWLTYWVLNTFLSRYS